MMGQAAQRGGVISFGAFTLIPGERLLTREGVPVDLGGRTLDTLIALVSRSGEIIDKRDLMALVWPDVTVDEGSLRFHIAGLRKALGDGKDGARYIATLAGRGYSFVAPVSRSASPADTMAPDTMAPDTTASDTTAPGTPPRHTTAPDATAAHTTARFRQANLPARLTRMIGRDEGVRHLVTQLTTTRFVTVVGAGGVGKTTLAVAAAHELIEAFAGAVLFLDFGTLSDAGLAAASLASMLGLSVQGADPVPSLIAHLRDKRVLLLLDNCEHLIEAVAMLASRIFAAGPQVHVLATSREAFRVEGEQVHRLAPLGYPPEDSALSASATMRFPAAQLFVERALASGASFDLTDANAAIVANICRKLDGVPLAIELAAGRVEAYGLEQTAALLDRRLALLWQGQRTAPPRQKTLQATLDWSFGLLSDLERLVLRRLAVFAGYFTLDGALAVVTNATFDKGMVVGALDSLIAKSMVATRPAGAMMRYRLLDTTRAYTREINLDPAEAAELAGRHAVHYRHWLQDAGADWPNLATAAERAPHMAALANVRAALEWCFAASGDTGIGIGLAAAAAPVFLTMSLLGECHRWSSLALAALPGSGSDNSSAEEMQLQTALGLSTMFTRGNSDDVRIALTRGLDLAEQVGHRHYQLQLLGGLHLFHERIGAFSQSLPFARRSETVAREIGDPVGIAAAHSWLGISHHLMGNVELAHGHLTAALTSPRVSRGFNTIQIGFEYHNRAHITLARNLWLRGYPDQAEAVARETVEEAAGLEHPVTLCMALIWAVTVFAWRRDWASVEEAIDRFIAHAEKYSLAPYLGAGTGVKGELSIRRGDVIIGIQALRYGLEALHAGRYELLTTELVSALAEGLALTGQSQEALATIDRAIEQAALHGRYFTMPELLRIKADILLKRALPDRPAAEDCLLQSLDMSRRQAARAWELRTAVDLAALWARDGERARARALVEPVFAWFTEGFDTVDLRAAARTLTELS